MIRTLLPLLALVSLAGCAVEREAPPPVSPLDAQALEELLLGRAEPCAADEDCASGLCRFDTCVGALSSDHRWIQETIATRLRAVVQAQPALAPGAVAALEGALVRMEPGDFRARARAAFLAGYVPGDEAGALLVRWLREGAPNVQRAAALALVGQGHESGLALALTELAASAPLRRAEAARALGGLDAPASRDALLAALDDESRFVRANAIESLGAFGDPALAPVLRRAMAAAVGSDQVLYREALRRSLRAP